MQFNRKYADSIEEMERRQIWEQKVIENDRHNLDFEKELVTWTQGENDFTDRVHLT